MNPQRVGGRHRALWHYRSPFNLPVLLMAACSWAVIIGIIWLILR